MTVQELAAIVIDACESEGIEHMLTGALAYNHYGVPRSTQDVDFVVQFQGEPSIHKLHRRLESVVEFEPQLRFDTLTWGSRQVGTTLARPPLKVELFDLLDDPFARSAFSRRSALNSAEIGRTIWIPTPEDVVIQKLRWGRSKDLDDARHVLAVQGTDALDMAYVGTWCAEHGTADLLEAALEAISPL